MIACMEEITKKKKAKWYYENWKWKENDIIIINNKEQ